MEVDKEAPAPKPLATPDEEYVPNILRISQEELQRKADAADEVYESCVSCGRRCLDNRQAGKLGKCNTGMNAHVSSFFPHFGEEDCLRGRKGSGTIFFTNCNLKCMYCQNYDVSQPEGDVYHHEDEEIAKMMIKLQNRGCHNINFVSPTHVVAPIMRAVVLAKKMGLRLPIVYNTGGYDSPETLEILDGVVDIYMPDMKYSDKKLGRKYSRIDNYPEVNRAAVKEMHRQVGQLVLDRKTGLAKRGLLIRHLVLPNDQAGSEDLAEWVATELGKDTYVNVMAQYRPEHKAKGHEKLGRALTKQEFKRAVQAFQDRGICRLDHRYEAFQNCLYNDLMAPLMQQDLEW
jgi:putative pyruvate formate lyase activating enzyme